MQHIGPFSDERPGSPLGLLAVLLLLSLSGSAQTYRVFGRVIDGAGQPLPGATVLPQGSRSAAVTDADGRYDLPLRDPGEVAIRFTFIGFAPVTRKTIPTPEGTRLDVRRRPPERRVEGALRVGHRRPLRRGPHR